MPTESASICRPDQRRVRPAMRAGRWLLLPFGSVEQHGPHLPLGTDLFYGEHVCLAVAEQVNGLVAPGFPYGICRTMRNFPGTVSLSPETFTPMLREVLAEYVRHDARKLALIAGHAEEAQNGAMREAVLPFVNADPALKALVIGPYDFLDPVREEAGLVGTDGHAGSIETSEMLVIAEDKVRLDRHPRGHPAAPLPVPGDGRTPRPSSPSACGATPPRSRARSASAP